MNYYSANTLLALHSHHVRKAPLIGVTVLQVSKFRHWEQTKRERAETKQIPLVCFSVRSVLPLCALVLGAAYVTPARTLRLSSGLAQAQHTLTSWNDFVTAFCVFLKLHQ